MAERADSFTPNNTEAALISTRERTIIRNFNSAICCDEFLQLAEADRRSCLRLSKLTENVTGNVETFILQHSETPDCAREAVHYVYDGPNTVHTVSITPRDES